MPVKLREALKETLEHWPLDLPQEWQDILGKVTLGYEAVNPSLELELWEPIFPARRDQQFPGMPKGSHMLRAFERVMPNDVRCVILGQDPYPEPGFSTGRAFEAGNIRDWSELDKMFSKSIRVYMQLLVAARTGDPAYAESFDEWPRTLAYLSDLGASFEAPFEIADHLESQGVLLLNSALTLSRFAVQPGPHQTQGHLPLWAPLIQATLNETKKGPAPVVFIGFGDAAADALTGAGIKEGQTGHIGCILRAHPAFADEVLPEPNPFELCNSYLEAMGAVPIAW